MSLLGLLISMQTEIGTFDVGFCNPIVYKPVGYRVLRQGEWYQSKTGHVLKKRDKNYSKRAKNKVIVVLEKS